jgi:hypothetical protein
MTDKKKYIRKTKNERFINEQTEILNKLNQILNINEKNKYFIIEDYDNFEYKNEILNLIEDIKKYFVYNRWTYFNHNSNDFLSLIKSIYNEMNYDILCKKINIDKSKNIIFCYITNKNI